MRTRFHSSFSSLCSVVLFQKETKCLCSIAFIQSNDTMLDSGSSIGRSFLIGVVLTSCFFCQFVESCLLCRHHCHRRYRVLRCRPTMALHVEIWRPTSKLAVARPQIFSTKLDPPFLQSVLETWPRTIASQPYTYFFIAPVDGKSDNNLSIPSLKSSLNNRSASSKTRCSNPCSISSNGVRPSSSSRSRSIPCISLSVNEPPPPLHYQLMSHPAHQVSCVPLPLMSDRLDYSPCGEAHRPTGLETRRKCQCRCLICVSWRVVLLAVPLARRRK
mmetsp:Transcript_19504/g.35303  ORF Transcript_19504/g.35303 Transcript_19504/m.35303 type:complete len:273 (+) Transcript_19504:543-1361(+)